MIITVADKLHSVYWILFKELYSAIIIALETLESSINKETVQKSNQLLSTIINDTIFVYIY